MSFFQTADITAGYGKNRILHGISFSAEAHHIVGVLGPNGCGKSTLLKAICGILPHDGSCALDGTHLEALSPRQLARLAGYIPQRSGISIDISALDVVLMGFNPRLGLFDHPSPAMAQQALRALQAVGLEGKEQQNFMTLSEGQKQLCVLARALCSDAKMLILDEPESALDFRYRFQMFAILRRWIRETPRCAIVALHDPTLALNCCDRLLLMADGRICHTVCPKTDTLGQIACKLSAIYGPISLHRCADRQGREHILMVKEDIP